MLYFFKKMILNFMFKFIQIIFQFTIRWQSIPALWANVRNTILAHICWFKWLFHSPEISSSRMHPKYVTLFYWDILISPLLMSSISSFFKRLLDPNTMDLVLSSPKWMLSLFSTNQSHNELKFLFKLSSIILIYLSVKT